MNTTLRSLALPLALLATLALGGCKGRMLLAVEDGAPGADRTTVLKTLDTANYFVMGITKVVFWECGETPEGLVCKQTCDVKDDDGDMLRCQAAYTYGF